MVEKVLFSLEKSKKSKNREKNNNKNNKETTKHAFMMFTQCHYYFSQYFGYFCYTS